MAVAEEAEGVEDGRRDEEDFERLPIDHHLLGRGPAQPRAPAAEEHARDERDERPEDQEAPHEVVGPREVMRLVRIRPEVVRVSGDDP